MTREEFNRMSYIEIAKIIESLEQENAVLTQENANQKSNAVVSKNLSNQLVQSNDYLNQKLIFSSLQVENREKRIDELERKLQQSEAEFKISQDNNEVVLQTFRGQVDKLKQEIQKLKDQIEDNRKDLLTKDDELVSVKIDRAELQKAKDSLFKEIHRHCEIKDQMEEDLALLKDILKVFVKERNSRE